MKKKKLIIFQNLNRNRNCFLKLILYEKFFEEENEDIITF